MTGFCSIPVAPGDQIELDAAFRPDDWRAKPVDGKATEEGGRCW